MSSTENDKIKIALSQPLETGSGKITELVMKHPTLRTMRKVGGSFIQNFVSYDDDGKMEIRQDFDAIKLGATIAELSDVDEITVNELSAADATKVARELAKYYAA